MKDTDMIDLIKQTFSEWSEDKASMLAAALSYYTVFSLAPILVIVIAVASLFISQETVQAEILAQIESLMGEEGRGFIAGMLEGSEGVRSAGIIATIIGVVTLLFGALGVFTQLQVALNMIFDVKPEPVKGIQGTVKRLIIKRFLSFTMLLVIGFLLLVSLVVSALITALTNSLSEVIPVPPLVLQIINLLVSFGVITLLFAMIFKILPDVKIAWRDVWLGAAITSLLFTLGKFAIGLYLGRSAATSIFGAAGSLALVLIWIYYSAQILFWGAEFTQVYANRFGSGIEPEEGASLISSGQPAEMGFQSGASGLSPAHAGRWWTEKSGQYSYGLTSAVTGAGSGGGLSNKILYSIILVSQFIPALRSLSSKKAVESGESL